MKFNILFYTPKKSIWFYESWNHGDPLQILISFLKDHGFIYIYFYYSHPVSIQEAVVLWIHVHKNNVSHYLCGEIKSKAFILIIKLQNIIFWIN